MKKRRKGERTKSRVNESENEKKKANDEEGNRK